jgi:hypothetical protein
MRYVPLAGSSTGRMLRAPNDPATTPPPAAIGRFSVGHTGAPSSRSSPTSSCHSWALRTWMPRRTRVLLLGLDRVSREWFADALLITSVGTVAAVGLDMVFIPRHGIVGAGLGWLIGQTLAALVAIRTSRHELATGSGCDPGGGRSRPWRPSRLVEITHNIPCPPSPAPGVADIEVYCPATDLPRAASTLLCHRGGGTHVFRIGTIATISQAASRRFARGRAGSRATRESLR